jgi:hypothetical protein
MNEQLTALHLAEALEAPLSAEWMKEITLDHIAAELRRLHEVNKELVEALERLMSCAIDVDHGYLKYAINHAEAALAKAKGEV